MNSNGKESQPYYPTISPPTEDYTNPFHQPSVQETQPQMQPAAATSAPSSSSPPPPADQNSEKWGTHIMGAAAATAAPSSSSPPPPADQNSEKWGTHIMGAPAVPTCHPDNKKAAMWGAGDQAQYYHHPYLQYSPVEKSSNSPMESMLQVFNTWSHKAETMANNIWHNLRTGSSVSGAAWGKMNVTAKAISGGGFESLYKQTFATYSNEKLKKSFACYLSTSTGPVAGTLYLSNIHVAFCSDRPLSFTAPSGQVTWSYYKVMIPLSKIGIVNPVTMRENPLEKYIQMVTVDGHDFWYMGFVNYEKASKHLSESVSSFVATGVAVQPPSAA
ncbi:GEM-like protein 5 [Hibiscus syriacus]|uniref:GEM-like protein 5 n=1 Tax=Hibiscus syriacus TaxID=106335 RepID=A0A6A2ZDB8_HIBSY|nr:GEM-like protein 5 [Hibiscus syriacus]KAE8689399.1 GEM-like protein 5 [Hibiscus syriacus]